MPIISRVLAAGQLFIRRRPWSVAMIILVLLYFLARGCYVLLAPEDAWLDQGWLALRNGRYPEAEQCFLRARGKGPRDVLPRLALLTMFRHEQLADPKPRGYFGQWDGLPWLGHYLKAAETYWAGARARHCRRAAPPLYRWSDEQFSEQGVAEGLFYDYWMVYPREVREAVAIIRAVEQGQHERAWAAYLRLQRRNLPVCNTLFSDERGCYRYLLQAAWHTHHLTEVERIVLSRYNTPDAPFPQELDLRYNARLGLAPRVTARVWSVRTGQWARTRVPVMRRATITCCWLPRDRARSFLPAPATPVPLHNAGGNAGGNGMMRAGTR